MVIKWHFLTHEADVMGTKTRFRTHETTVVYTKQHFSIHETATKVFGQQPAALFRMQLNHDRFWQQAAAKLGEAGVAVGKVWK